ncbi:MAG: hypothetical protein VX278_18190 [Myxococcota bacterium]|nr:hypothetical protein [Myxococcota bacterium]
MRLLFKRMWRRWKAGIHRINDGIAFVLMTFTYFFAVMPVALGFKFLRRDLLDRGLEHEGESYWLEKQNEPQDIRRVQRLY